MLRMNYLLKNEPLSFQQVALSYASTVCDKTASLEAFIKIYQDALKEFEQMENNQSE